MWVWKLINKCTQSIKVWYIFFLFEKNILDLYQIINYLIVQYKDNIRTNIFIP